MRHIDLLSNSKRSYFFGDLGSGDGCDDGILDIVEKLYH